MQQVKCSKCSWAGLTDIPENQTNNVLWECHYCNNRNDWVGSDGPAKVYLPKQPEGIISVIDTDSAISENRVG